MRTGAACRAGLLTAVHRICFRAAPRTLSGWRGAYGALREIVKRQFVLTASISAGIRVLFLECQEVLLSLPRSCTKSCSVRLITRRVSGGQIWSITLGPGDAH